MRALLLLALLLPACLDVADARARRDEQVGQAAVGTLGVAVDDGLAAVMSLSAGALELWANAPELTFHVTGLEPGTFEVRIANTLAAAEVVGATDEDAPLTVVELPAAGQTRRWVATLAAAGGARFALVSTEPAGPYRIAVFGDVQEAVPRVQDIFDRMNQDDQIRFVLMTGDQTQRGQPEQLARFKAALAGLGRPCYMTLGNHELGVADGLFQDYFGRGSSHFVHRGLHVTFLDSASATLAPQVHDWLDDWLVRAQGQPHMVLTHYPLLDPIGLRNGAFASRAEGAAVAAQVARAGVGALFHGHVHSFYKYTTAGVPSFISGGGGAIPEAWDGIGRHFLTVDVDPARLDFEVAVVRVDGAP